MFVGHLAIGFIAKQIEPKVSLGTWIVAVLFSDLLVFPLLIAEIESFKSQPGAVTNRMVGQNIAYSHSLLMTAIWAFLLAAIYFLWRRYLRGAGLLFGAVLSHWLLDFISHRPDMPLAPGRDEVFGLGLWNSIPATLIVEGGFWLLTIFLYARAAKPQNRAGKYAFWIGIILLTLLWFGNINSSMDPNPVRAGIGGLIVFSLIIGWAYWINKVRPFRV